MTEVDLELVLAVDVSGSIDIDEARLQRAGYVAALVDDAVVAAITGGPKGRIAVTYVEWAGPEHQRTVVDWTMLDSREAAENFAARLSLSELMGARRTSISSILLYALPMFETNRYTAPRQVIDISGDGPNNSGLLVAAARDLVVDTGVTINGLPILNMRPSPMGFPILADLDLYYEDCVIGGPGSFVIAAESIDTFGAAIRRKLILEIAGRVPSEDTPGRRHAGASQPRLIPANIQNMFDCTIGERQLRQWLRDNFEP